MQFAAASALREVLFYYFSNKLSPADMQKLRQLALTKHLKALKEDGNVAVTRGAALALGAASRTLLLDIESSPTEAASLEQSKEVLAVLTYAMDRRTVVAGEADTLTRCRAVEAAVDIAERILAPDEGKKDYAVQGDQWLLTLLEALFGCCEDYRLQ